MNNTTSDPVLANRDDVTLIKTEPHLVYIYITIGTIGFFGNVFVIFVIGKTKSMRKLFTNIYIINQSSIDTLVATFLILTSAFEDDGRFFDSAADRAFCQFWLTKGFLWSTMMTSTYNLLALTTERYLAIVHPIWHKTKFNRSKVFISIACVWVIGPLTIMTYAALTSGITAKGSCTTFTVWPSPEAQRAVGIINIFLMYILPLIVLVFCYTRMVMVLRRPGTTESKDDNMARARRNIIKTLAMVAFVFILCWTWNQIFFLLFNFGYQGVDFTGVFYHFTVVMVFLNCTLNPFVYMIKYEQFQSSVKKMICKNRVESSAGNTSQSTSVH